jgi:hypothetical protein
MTEAQWQDFKTNILPKVLAGSDEARGFTGNASAGVARRQRAHGTPNFDLRGEGGDQYFNEGPFTHSLPRLPGVASSSGVDGSGKPVGVTRLPAPSNAASSPSNAASSGDLDYLSAHGGHSTLNGKSGAVGGAMGFDPEFAARLRAAGEAYEKETGQKPRYGEADRDAATQAKYWEESGHGTKYPAAPPGRSRHQSGNAMDLPSGGFRDWLKSGNVQANPAFKG